jgi:hypothetical protein
MSDLLLRLRYALFVLKQAFKYIWTDVLFIELDKRTCCNGYECGCFGETYRGLMEDELRRGYE